MIAREAGCRHVAILGGGPPIRARCCAAAPGLHGAFVDLLAAPRRVDSVVARDPGPISGIMWSVGTRILAVEDDERIRSAVKLALEDEGWTVDEAESGEAGDRTVPRTAPDVVLIDIMLPGIDGFELCRTLRRTSDVPIVMVTARNDTHDIVAGLEAGADDYLTKPFAPKELSARIRALLRRIRPIAPGHARLVVRRPRADPRRGQGPAQRRRGAPHQDRVPPAVRAGARTRARCSAARRCSTRCGDTTTSATAGWSTSTSAGCAPRSRTTRPNPRHVVTVRGLGYRLAAVTDVTSRHRAAASLARAGDDRSAYAPPADRPARTRPRRARAAHTASC